MPHFICPDILQPFSIFFTNHQLNTTIVHYSIDISMPNPSNDNDFIMSCKQNAIAAMGANISHHLNHVPNAFQQQIMSHALMTMKQRITFQPTLLVHSTGSDKSAVPQTCSYSMPDIVIVVKNIIDLSADQTSKATNLQSNNMFAFQLDQMKSAVEIQQLKSAV